MNASVANCSRNTTVDGSGASTAFTMKNMAFRSLTTPAGGKMILSKLAFTSREVSGVPSWNLTPLRSLKVYVRPSELRVQLSATSPTNAVGSDGFIGSTLTSRL